MKTDAHIQLARHYRDEAQNLILGQYGDETRLLLFIGFVDIAFEHHESILLLLEKKLTGSAFALLRSLFEALFRAHWVAGCATEEEVMKIRINKFEYPAT